MQVSLGSLLFIFCAEAHVNRSLGGLVRCETDPFTALGLEVDVSWFFDGFVCPEFDFMSLLCHVYLLELLLSPNAALKTFPLTSRIWNFLVLRYIEISPLG